MSSETDHPRQRTVAELLAAHGDTGSSGRRHRRRAPEGPEDTGAPAEPSGAQPGGVAFAPDAFGSSNPAGWRSGPAPLPDRGTLREPVPREPFADRSVLREPVPPMPRSPEPPVEAPRPTAPSRRREPEPFGQQQPSGSQQLPERSYAPAPNGNAPGGAPNGGPPNGSGPHGPNGNGSNGTGSNGMPTALTPTNGNGNQPYGARGGERSFAPPRPAPPVAPPQATPPMAPPVDPPYGQQQPTGQLRNGQERAYAAPPTIVQPPIVDQPTEIATDELPRIRAEVRPDPRPPAPRQGSLIARRDPGLTGPIDVPKRAAEPEEWDDSAWVAPDMSDAGPATVVGAAPAGAEPWHRSRTSRRRGAAAPEDGGPPTQASSPVDFDDHPAGLGGELDDEYDDYDDEYDEGDEDEGEEFEPGEKKRRLGRSGDGSSSPGQAWAAVVAQWIIGAIGGAALWVGFRFLWRELPVVALAAAALVTVGLVVVVRALLRNNDMRTTLFAVGVGLLLTVSPAILVLLGR